MTIVEKILARTVGRPMVTPGEYLEITPNCVVVSGCVISGTTRLHEIREWGRPLYAPEKLMIVDGHLGATASEQAARARTLMEEWVEAMGIPDENFYRLGRGGIENMFAAEKCWGLPGECFFQSVNGHISTVGALGVFVFTVSNEKLAYLTRGKTWVKVPRTLRVNVVGAPGSGVMARDVSEALLRQIGPTGAVGAVIEWGGEYIEQQEMDGRLAICSQAIFSGAWTAIVNPDEKTFAYVRSRTDKEFDPLVSDDDAAYWKTVELDISDLQPQVVVPPTRTDIRDIGSVVGQRITTGFIGSDAGGWLSDLRAAGRILKEKQIQNNVILNITPGTVEILKGALREGLLETFIDAGCVVPSPCEGMECGYNTPLGDRDICIASAQTNYPGRMGSSEAQIYLANASVVAASCLEGKITDPRPYLN